MAWDALSPDGISIDCEDTYPTVEAAKAAIDQWVQRYAEQGYYSTVRRERIPLDEIAGRCRIVEACEEDETA